MRPADAGAAAAAAMEVGQRQCRISAELAGAVCPPPPPPKKKHPPISSSTWRVHFRGVGALLVQAAGAVVPAVAHRAMTGEVSVCVCVCGGGGGIRVASQDCRGARAHHQAPPPHPFHPGVQQPCIPAPALPPSPHTQVGTASSAIPPSLPPSLPRSPLHHLHRLWANVGHGAKGGRRGDCALAPPQ